VEPPAGLTALDTLIDRSRAAGLNVAVVTEGDKRALSPSVDQAAFQILREALTNAARHGSGRADVELRFAPDALEIVVSNPVAPGAAVTDGGGHGILGMKERALLLGGTLEAVAERVTFRIRASLPYRDGR
jgi:signal transduction histidine kinase